MFFLPMVSRRESTTNYASTMTFCNWFAIILLPIFWRRKTMNFHLAIFFAYDSRICTPNAQYFIRCSFSLPSTYIHLGALQWLSQRMSIVKSSTLHQGKARSRRICTCKICSNVIMLKDYNDFNHKWIS